MVNSIELFFHDHLSNSEALFASELLENIENMFDRYDIPIVLGLACTIKSQPTHKG